MNCREKSRAIFLDRDGVINIDKQYVCKIEDFEFTEGIFDLLRFLRANGYLLIVVTNQTGIGRGYYTQEDFEKVTAWKVAQLRREGIEIDAVYHCPHAPESACACRKPSPKMLLDAQRAFNIDMSRSWMVGDKQSDILAGKEAGVGKTVLVGDSASSHGSEADFHIEKISQMEALVRRFGC